MEEEQLAKKTLKIDALIQSMFIDNRDKVLPFDNHLFDMPIEQRLQFSTEQKRLWTECVEIATKA